MTNTNGRWRNVAAVAGVVAAAAAVLPLAGGASAQTAPAASVAIQAAVDTTITIRSSGTNLEFQPSSVSAKAGTRVRIRYVNEGTFPHNLVIMKDENDIDKLGLAAFKASKTGYVPVEFETLMVAHSELAIPGSTVEIEFVMPAAGEYTFVCLYPGHYNMMLGTLRSLK
ncbi:MAG: plastocyanin/azurin family copper-binding protein [Gemmatimonadota bacterium]